MMGDMEVRVPVPGADKFTTEQEALDRADQLGCEGTHSMDEDGQTVYMPCSTHAVYDALTGAAESRPYHDDEDEDRQEAEPAPKKDQIVGSDKNKPGSAGGAGGDIALSEATETALRNKVSEHNEAMEEQGKPPYTRTTFGQLAAVYRRGSGAFSGSHRPGVSRAAWSMARVNAYLYLLRNGRPQNPKYITDYDLLPEKHPKSTRSVETVESRNVDLTVPAYIQDAARQGLDFHADGKSGAGVVERTLRDARAMAQGDLSEDKAVRASAWAARHATDLTAEGARPGEDGYPTPGAVAHLLWGIPTGARYDDAVAFFDRKSEQVKADRSIGMEVTPVTPRTKGSGVEFRSFTGELRQEGDGNTFVGYAAVFNSDSEPLPFIERIAPGAFAKSLRNRKRDIRLYVNHDSSMVLASRNSGTLTLSEDARGLRVEAELPDTSAGRDMRELMRSGIVDKMSFGFQVDTRGDKWSDDGRERTLTAVRLFEVSIVTGHPAYESTMAAVRSLERLSERTGMAVDELSEALDLLAEGATLPADKAAVLLDAIKASSPAPEPAPVNLLGLKQKHLDLLAKKVW